MASKLDFPIYTKFTNPSSRIAGIVSPDAVWGMVDLYFKKNELGVDRVVTGAGIYEPVFSKNTGFNRDFGTTASNVAYGNHTHSGMVQDSADEVISGAWAFTGTATFGVAPHFNDVLGIAFTVAPATSSMIENLNADMVDGKDASYFSISTHDHDSDYEPLDTNITKDNEAETITGSWTYDAAGVLTFETVPVFTNPVTPFTVVGGTGMVSNLDANYLNGKADSDFELSNLPHQTGFNLPLGTTSNSVAYGNHTHSGFTEDSANEVISGAWAFTGTAEFGVAPTFSMTSGAPFTIPTTTAVVTNLNADRLDGQHASAFEPADSDITKKNETETITANWVFSGTPNFTGVPNFSNAALPFAVSATSGKVVNLDSHYLNGKEDSYFEAAIGTKNTAFNKNFGTTSSTVAYGNHTHSGFTQDSANEVISGAWTFTGAAEFGTRPTFSSVVGAPFIVSSITASVVTNLNADKLDGIHASSFSQTSHNHSGVYEPADADITKRNESESVTANWTFSGTPVFSGVPNFSNAALPFSVHSSSGMVANLDANYLNGKADSDFAAMNSTNTGYFHTTANSSLPAIRARQDGVGYLQDWYDGTTQRAYMTQAGLLVSDDFKGLSDERLKAKVVKIRNSDLLQRALELSKLIRRYERTDKDNAEEIGWVAQKLYKIAPEYVHKPKNKDDMWAVGYSKMVVPLYGALADIDTRLKIIENKLTKW